MLLDRALEYTTLKDVKRTGWVLRGVADSESVADHSWGTAQLCLLFAAWAEQDPALVGLDRHRAVSMALVHDLAEVEVGDIPRRMQADPDRQAAKAELESAAIMRMTAPGGTSLQMVRDLWTDYEEARSPSARFVRDMNLVDMCLQAFVYERDERYDPASGADAFPDYPRMTEFFETSRSRCTTMIGMTLHRMAEERYRDLVRSNQENRIS